MRSQGDLTGLIKFLARDDWKSCFEAVLGEHFGPVMQEFDLEYEAIGATLGGGWDMTLWGVAFEDFLGRRFEPDGRTSSMNISSVAAGTNRLRPKPICGACGTRS